MRPDQRMDLDPDRVLRLAQTLGCTLQPEEALVLVQYGRLIQHWNRRKRIVGSTDPGELVGVHFADGLALAGQLQRQRGDGQRLVDVGSGAGLPGLILAVAIPRMRVTLCEPAEKRVAFLHHAVRTLDVTLEIRHQSVQQLIDSGARYDHAVSRATFEPGQWLDLGRACLTPAGTLWCMLTAAQFARFAGPGTPHTYEVAGQRSRVLLRVPSTGPVQPD